MRPAQAVGSSPMHSNRPTARFPASHEPAAPDGRASSSIGRSVSGSRSSSIIAPSPAATGVHVPPKQSIVRCVAPHRRRGRPFVGRESHAARNFAKRHVEHLSERRAVGIETPHVIQRDETEAAAPRSRDTEGPSLTAEPLRDPPQLFYLTQGPSGAHGVRPRPQLGQAIAVQRAGCAGQPTPWPSSSRS